MSENSQEREFHWSLQVQESFGTIFLGAVCILLIISLWKSEERYKALVLELLSRRQ